MTPRPLPPPDLELMLHSSDMEVLREAAADRRLTEDLALMLLQRRELHGSVIEAVSRNQSVMKHRKVILAVVAHPRSPRYVSLPVARRLFTFELTRIAMSASVPADVKRMAEDTVISRLDTVSSGERMTLAKLSTSRIVAALLNDSEERVRAAALMNPRLTEALVVVALMRENVRPELVQELCVHPKWSLRRDVQAALLRKEHTPLARAMLFAQQMPAATLREVLRDSRLAESAKNYLERELQRRKQ